MDVQTDRPPSGSINKSGQSQHGLRLYQCLSSWLWAGRSRGRLIYLVSSFGEYRRPTLLDFNSTDK